MAQHIKSACSACLKPKFNPRNPHGWKIPTFKWHALNSTCTTASVCSHLYMCITHDTQTEKGEKLINKITFKNKNGAGELPQCLRELGASLQDLYDILSTHMLAHSCM